MDRFAFRQIDYRDLGMFFRDGGICSKNHSSQQRCHQTSYAGIVNMRGTPAFNLPHDGVVNDYVAFYFSPITAFTHTISRGNVNVLSPSGENLGQSRCEDRAFFVFSVNLLRNSGLMVSFSDFALNSHAPAPTVTDDFNQFPTHVKWSLFDDDPYVARIPEIGYKGVCRYFQSRDTPPAHHARSSARMAELLVKDFVSLDLCAALVVQNENVLAHASRIAATAGFGGKILLKNDCFR